MAARLTGASVLLQRAHLICLYTNASSMKNKQDKLEASALSQSYDVSGISEIWQDKTHSWSAGMEGYQKFRKDRQDRRGRGVLLYVRER